MPRFHPLVCLVFASALLAGCGGSPWDAAEVADVSAAVLAAAPDAAGALSAPADVPLGPVEVYVDLSLSVQPYLSDGAEPAVLPRLLEAFDGALGGDVALFGFGFESDTLQTVTPMSVGALLRPGSYVRRNNDYGALFERFSLDATGDLGALRVVLTDGVESDPEGGRRFGRVVAEVDRWVRAGGTFATLVYRSGYAGRYYSEAPGCAGSGFALSCGDRPLLAFVFAPHPEQLDRLQAALAAAGGAGSPQTAVRVGSRDATLTPLASIEGERRPERLLRQADDVIVPGLEPITTGRLATQAADADGFVPLSFALDVDPARAPWSRLTASARAEFMASLRPRVRVWATDTERDSTVLVELDAEVRGATVSSDSSGTRVTIPVRRPVTSGAADGARRFAWLVEMVPYETASMLVPADLSTVSDCNAEACSRTLNLAPLLGAVLRDDYVPARALLLTEWR